MSGRDHATAFAPATVANVAVGFDVLGFSLPVIGDRVRVERAPEGRIVLERVDGLGDDIPVDPERNTATVALRSLAVRCGEPWGFRVRVHKGIPLSSGMGGSAASAVAAVVAANALLETPLSTEELCVHAREGESSATGAAHLDNVAPCLFGGLTLVVSHDPVQVVRLPVPDGLCCVLVRPHLRLETRQARGVLADHLALADHSRQSAYLAGFVAACFREDLDLLRRCFHDVIVEPQRSALIPGFADVKRAALDAGALGASISGAGPSVFAWASSPQTAKRVGAGMTAAFAAHGIQVDAWTATVGGRGAHLVEPDDGPG